MQIDAIISITGILLGVVGIVCVIVAGRKTVTSAEPDPERVRSFVKSAPPIPKHLLKEPDDEDDAAF